MNEFTVVLILFMAGVLVLIAEIFIPSHGVLGLVGIGFLGYAIFKAYDMDSGSGHLTLASAAILVPTLAIVGVKYFHRTPIGKRIAPDAPDARADEFAPHHKQLKRYVGLVGRSITPLRPVGACMIDGERINCVAEAGFIESDAPVEVLRIKGAQLEVRRTGSLGAPA